MEAFGVVITDYNTHTFLSVFFGLSQHCTISWGCFPFHSLPFVFLGVCKFAKWWCTARALEGRRTAVRVATCTRGVVPETDTISKTRFIVPFPELRYNSLSTLYLQLLAERARCFPCAIQPKPLLSAERARGGPIGLAAGGVKPLRRRSASNSARRKSVSSASSPFLSLSASLRRSPACCTAGLYCFFPSWRGISTTLSGSCGVVSRYGRHHENAAEPRVWNSAGKPTRVIFCKVDRILN